MRQLSEEDVDSLLVGAQILGCGGGGEAAWSGPLIEEVYSQGKRFQLVEPAELPDDELTFIVGMVGGGVSAAAKRRVASLPVRAERMEVAAERALATYLGREPYAFVATELGAGNTVVPLYVAAVTNRCAVDGDCCGRAKPEIAISTTHVHGIPVTPLAVVSPFGDTLILRETIDDYRAEDICRELAAISGGRCGVARCPTPGRRIREAVVPNSISRCIKIGYAIRRAHDKSRDPVEVLAQETAGRRVFDGRVERFEREERGAFMWGTILLRGVNGFRGRRLRVWYKNEHLISWLDDRPYATCPDLICIVDTETAHGLSNWGRDFRRGRRVSVVAVPAAPVWRTPRGLEIFGPQHFGYRLRYRPLEQLAMPPAD